MKLSKFFNWIICIAAIVAAYTFGFFQGRGTLSDEEHYQVVFRVPCDENCTALSDNKIGDPVYQSRMTVIYRYDMPFFSETPYYYQFYWEGNNWVPSFHEGLVKGILPQTKEGKPALHYDYINSKAPQVSKDWHPGLNTELPRLETDGCPYRPARTHRSFMEPLIKKKQAISSL
ncbi:MAG: hypothetical protein AB2552_17500 [Candidatus Thiodiazotropha endolucinida]